MTPAQIKCFIAVVEEGGYSKASGELFISQPAISKSIFKLEEELGFALLERKKGNVQTTEAGAAVYQFMKKARDEFDELLTNINNSLKGPSGTVRIGCPETWNPAMFYSRVVEHFKAKHPAVNLVLECHRLPTLMSRLQNGKIDILMTHEFYPSVQNSFAVQHLTDTNCGILYSNMFFKNIHTLADLKDANFLHFDSDIEKRFGTVIKKVCAEYGFTPTMKNCGQYTSALFELSCGRGIMFFTSWDNAVRNSNYSFLPLDYISPINLIYSAAPSNPHTRIFVRELVSLFSEDTHTP